MSKFNSRILVALLTFGIGLLGGSFWIAKSKVSQSSVKEIETINKADSVVPTPVNLDSNDNENAVVKKSNVNSTISKDSFRVDAYEDNELISRSFFRKGLLIKSIWFNTQTKKQESEVEYLYKDGELKRTKIKGESASIYSELEADRSERDFQFRLGILKSKNIEIPYAKMFGNEVNDLSEILSVADNYNDFRTEIIENGNQKTIKFTSFNKNISLKHSIISMLIHLYGTKINFTIKDYELTLEDNHPSKEIFDTDDGEVVREFFYKEGRVTKIVYRYTNLENQTNSLEKRFAYHKLN
jgi:hypothetical protein